MNLKTAIKYFLTYCKSSKNLSIHTLRAYKIDLNDFLSFTGEHKDLNQCNKHLFRNFIRHLFEEKKVKETTVKRRLACLKILFRWLEDEEYISTDPLYRLNERICLPKNLPRTLTRHEIGKLLLHCRQTINLPALTPISVQALEEFSNDISNLTCLLAVEILFATGIRVSELVNIDPDDLDLTTGTVLISGKGNRQRLVFIPDSEIIILLQNYMFVREICVTSANKLMINRRGGNASSAVVRKLISKAAKNAGIKRHITPHMLRHTTATPSVLT